MVVVGGSCVSVVLAVALVIALTVVCILPSCFQAHSKDRSRHCKKKASISQQFETPYLSWIPSVRTSFLLMKIYTGRLLKERHNFIEVRKLTSSRVNASKPSNMSKERLHTSFLIFTRPHLIFCWLGLYLGRFTCHYYRLCVNHLILPVISLMMILGK